MEIKMRQYALPYTHPLSLSLLPVSKFNDSHTLDGKS